nr:hypothetical protein [Tanacetum cinerariifolium]
MLKNLDSVTKFLMYPRFVQVVLNNQLEELASHTRIYVTPCHTKKLFGNIKMVGKGFSGRVTPLFSIMMVQAQEEIEFVTDEAVTEKMDDRLVKASTTASSLEVERDNGGSPRHQDTMRDVVAQTSLKRRVKKLEKKQRSRNHKLKRLYKVGLSASVESSNDEGLGKEDASKHGRIIDDLDADEDIILVNDQEMFNANKDLQGEELVVE